MEKCRRLFAILLSVMMITTYMPAMAFAEAEAGSDGDEVVTEEAEEAEDSLEAESGDDGDEAVLQPQDASDGEEGDEAGDGDEGSGEEVGDGEEEGDDEEEEVEDDDTRVVTSWSFSKKNGADFEIEEGTCGYYDEDENFFRYYIDIYEESELLFDDGDTMTVTYEGETDPVTYTYVGWDGENGLEMEFARETDDGWDTIEYDAIELTSVQDEEWTTSTESCKFLLTYKNVGYEFPFSIVENHVKSFSFSRAGYDDSNPIELTEGIDGEWEEDSEGNAYFDYYLIFAEDDIVTINDTNYIYEEIEVEGGDAADWYFVNESDESDYFEYWDIDQYSNEGVAWETGTSHTITLVYNGVSCGVSVIIKENPIKSISFERPGLGEDGAIEVPQITDGGYYSFNFEDGDLLTITYNFGDGDVEVVYVFAENEDEEGSLHEQFEAEGDVPEGAETVIPAEDVNGDFYYEGEGSEPDTWQLGDVHKIELIYKGVTCLVNVKLVEAEDPDPEDPEHEHSLTYVAAAEATCTEAGNSEYWYCSDCGKYFSDAGGETEIEEGSWVIAATGHTLAETVTENAVAPTCTEDGSHDEVVYCTVCGVEISRETVTDKATGHSYGEWQKYDADKHMRVCANDESHVEYGEHTWGEGVVTKEATETEEGVTTYTCTVCGETKTEAIPKLTHTHTMTETEAKAATCTEAGNSAYWTCSGCGKYFSDAEGENEIEEGSWVIEATGHTESLPPVAENVVAATCTEDGSHDEVVYCSVCGVEISRETVADEATGHDYGDWQNYDADKHMRVCANDESHVEYGEHTWDEGEVTKEATETEEGEMTYTCTVCGGTRTESIPVTDTNLIASGSCGSMGYTLTWTLYKDGTLTISGSGEMENSKTHGWDDYKDSIVKVVIEQGVTSIGGYSFKDCTNLEDVTIPDSVTRIERYAFQECTALVSVDLPDGLKYIGDDAFNNCSSLENVELPNSVTDIEYCAFSGCSSLTSIVIPESIISTEDDKHLGTYAFSSCFSLTSVSIPDDFTYIPGGMLSGCTSLTSIEIPDGVTEIGFQAFRECRSLTEIKIPEGVTTIGEAAFYDCRSLTEVKIPDGVTKIEAQTFSECTSLKSISLPDAVTSIGFGAFYNCSGLTDIDLPEGITSLETGVFEYCSGLTDFSIPKNVESIGKEAFFYCSGLTSITIPDSVTSIGEGAFAHCNGLTGVTIPDSVETIYDEAFYYCENLKEIYIPETTTALGTDIFSKCSSDLIIRGVRGSAAETYATDNGITFVGEGEPDPHDCVAGDPVRENVVAATCTEDGSHDEVVYCTVCGEELSRETVTDAATGHTWDGGKVTKEATETEEGEMTYTCTVCGETKTETIPSIRIVDTGSCGDNVTWSLYGDGTLIISGSGKMTTYDKGSDVPWYESRSSITAVVIESGVTSAGSYAFYDCSNMKSVSLGNSVTSIGTYAFYNCSSLESITIPDSLKSADTYAFRFCDNLSAVYVSDISFWYGISFSAESNPMCCGAKLYIDGELATSITIPEGKTRIGNYLFEGCSSLESITIPDSVTSIGNGAFLYCSSLESITIPDSVTGIGEQAFGGCDSLESITIPDSVTSIGTFVFASCANLKAIAIPNNITSIGGGTFCYCSSLESITIPDSVTSIGDRAFDTCTGLTDVYFGGSQKQWERISIGSDNSCLTDATFHYHTHTLTETAAKEATCTEDGNSAYWYCSGCGKYFSDADNDIEIEENSWVIKAKGHTSAEPVIENEVAATCTTDGSHDEVVYCSVCGEELSRQTVTDEATGHKWDEGVETTPATEYEEGVMTYTCTACGETKTETIPPSATAVDTGSCGENVSWSLYDNGMLIISGTGAMKDVTSAADQLWYQYSDDVKSVIIKDGVTYIGAGAFAFCEKISDIDIPSSVSAIGSYAFEECNALEEIILPEGLTAIPEGAFLNCYGPIKIYIPESVTSIEKDAFAGCGIEEIDLPDGLTSLGKGAFSCSTLKSFTTPSGLTELPAEAFDRCEDLETITITDNIKSIGRMAFAYCSKLTSIEFPSGMTEVSEYMFEDCTSLKTVILPDSITSIGAGVFEGCTSLEDVAIPPQVTVIKSSTFDGCDSLKTISIPDGVTSLEYRAFGFCGSLESIVIPDSVTSLGNYSFSGCSNLKSATIPAGVTSFGSGVFSSCNEGLTIYGYPNTAAETYAADNNIKFEVIPHDHIAGDAVIENETAETCGKDGSYDEVVYCTVCLKELSRETKTVPATGEHIWGDAEYTVDEYKSKVTASHVCEVCGAEEHETVGVTSEVTKATCTEDGSIKYTSEKFDNEEFTVWTSEETIAATGHDWNEPTYLWSADYSSVTATRTCKNDPEHFQTETVKATAEVTKDATSEDTGIRTWTSAEFKNTAFEAQTAEEIIPKVVSVEEGKTNSAEALANADAEVAAAKASSTAALELAGDLDEDSTDEEIDEAVESLNQALEDAQKAKEAAQAALDAAQAYYDAAQAALDEINGGSSVSAAAIRIAAVAKAQDTSDLDEAEARVADAKVQLAAAKYNKASASNSYAKYEKAAAMIASVKAAQAIADAEDVANDSDATEAEKAEAAEAAEKAAAEAAELARSAEISAAETESLVEFASADENLAEDRAKDMDDLEDETKTIAADATSARIAAENVQIAAAEASTIADANNAAEAAKTKAEDAKTAVKTAADAVSEYETAADNAKALADKAAQTKSATDISNAQAAVNTANAKKTAAEKAISDANDAITDAAAALTDADTKVEAATKIGGDMTEASAKLSDASDLIGDSKTDISDTESSKADCDATYDSAKTVSDKAAADAAAAAAQAAAQTPAAPVEIIDLPAVKIAKPAAAKGKITAKWKKVTKKNLKKIAGIQIQVATDSGFTNIVKDVKAGKKKTSKKIGGLQKKTTYWVRVRAYAAGNHYSAWKTKKIKTK